MIKKYKKFIIVIISLLIFVISITYPKIINQDISKKINLNDCDYDIINLKSKLCIENVIKLSLIENKYDDLAEKIKILQNKYPSLETECHGITHKLGRESIKYYKNLKNLIEDTSTDACGEGMIHAVISEYVNKNIMRKDIFENITKICLDTKDSKRVLGCAHGLGHALAENLNLLESMKICENLYENYKNDYERLITNTYGRSCAYGVIMQAYAPFENVKNNKIYDKVEILDTCKNIKDKKSALYTGCVSALGFGLSTRIFNEYRKTFTFSKKDKEEMFTTCDIVDSQINFELGYGCFGSYIIELQRVTIEKSENNDNKYIKLYHDECSDVLKFVTKHDPRNDSICVELIKTRYTQELADNYLEYIKSLSN